MLWCIYTFLAVYFSLTLLDLTLEYRVRKNAITADDMLFFLFLHIGFTWLMHGDELALCEVV